MRFGIGTVKEMTCTMHRHSLSLQMRDALFHAMMRLEKSLDLPFVLHIVHPTRPYQICRQRQRILHQSKIQ